MPVPFSPSFPKNPPFSIFGPIDSLCSKSSGFFAKPFRALVHPLDFSHSDFFQRPRDSGCVSPIPACLSANLSTYIGNVPSPYPGQKLPRPLCRFLNAARSGVASLRFSGGGIRLPQPRRASLFLPGNACVLSGCGGFPFQPAFSFFLMAV